MTTLAVPLGGGVVLTRPLDNLQRGELEKAENCLMKPNDPDSLYRDEGRKLIETLEDPIVTGGFRNISFENDEDLLAVVTTNGSTSSLKVRNARDEGGGTTFTEIQSISGVVTGCSWEHWGDIWILGTNIENYAISGDRSVRVLGMDANIGEGWLPPVIVAVGAPATTVWDATGSGGEFDYILYFFTEYDSSEDIESQVVFASVAVVSLSYQVDLDWSGNTRLNANTDKVRIYRHYLGRATASDPGPQQESLLAYERFVGNDIREIPNAGFLAEVDWSDGSYVDNETVTKSDPDIKYPITRLSNDVRAGIYDYLRQTRPFDVGVIHDNVLVANDAGSSKNIYRWSPRKNFEYQPDPYFDYYANEHSDKLIGMISHQRGIVFLLEDSVHILTDLFFVGTFRGRRERISNIDGCVGVSAYTEVQSERQEYVAWVSRQGLRGTDGAGWYDLCGDFSNSAAGLVDSKLDQAVLINNERLHRLELWADTSSGFKRFDFLYHPSHLKGGSLKLIGPHEVPEYTSADPCLHATRGKFGGRSTVWTASAKSVYREGYRYAAGTMSVWTGHLTGESPLNDVGVERVGLTHAGIEGGTIRRYLVGKEQKERGERGHSKPELFTDDQVREDETSHEVMRINAQYARLGFETEDVEEHRWGPAWVQVRPKSKAAV